MSKDRILKSAIGAVFVIIVTATALYFLLPRLMIRYPPAPTPLPQSFDTSELIPRDPSKSTEFTRDVKLWKRFVSDIFSFSYPPEWSIQQVSASNVLLYTPDLLEPPKGAPITVSYNPQLSYADVTENIRNAIENASERTITDQNLSGIELSGNIQAPVVGQVGIFVTILNHRGKALFVEYTVYPGSQDYKDVYLEVVNSIEI